MVVSVLTEVDGAGQLLVLDQADQLLSCAAALVAATATAADVVTFMFANGRLIFFKRVTGFLDCLPRQLMRGQA